MDNSTPPNRARVSLQFNLQDDVQKYAYDILKTQGNRKSAFISAAIKFYIERGDWDPPARVAITNFHTYQVKEIIKAAIEEIGPKELAEILTSPNNSATSRIQPFSYTGETGKNINTENSPVSSSKPMDSSYSKSTPISTSPANVVENEEADDEDNGADALYDALSLFG